RAFGPGASVRITFPADQSGMRAEVVRVLSGHGVRAADSPDAIPIAAACSANLRERVCAAAIGRGEARRVVMTTRPRSGGDAGSEPAVAVAPRPVYAHRRPLLAVAAPPHPLLVRA